MEVDDDGDPDATPVMIDRVPARLPEDLCFETLVKFCSELPAPPPEPRRARGDYLVRLLARLEEAGCAVLPPRALYAALDGFYARLFLEALTRGQAEKDLWFVARHGLVTASTWYAVTRVPRGPVREAARFFVRPKARLEASRGVPALDFGVVNERAARRLLLAFVTGPPPGGGLVDRMYDAGVLVDNCSGLFAASFDYFVCPRTPDMGLLAFPGAGAELYEIKCRYGYLCDASPACRFYRLYLEYLADPHPWGIFDMVHAAPAGRPVVSVLCQNTAGPPAWPTLFHGRGKIVLKRMPDWERVFIRRHLELNEHIESTAVVFAPPDPDRRVIRPHCPRLADCPRLPFYANPRHKYFYQVALQGYVSGTYSCPARAHLVNAFFRRRRAEEVGVDYLLEGEETGFACRLPAECDVPLLLLITPVVTDRALVRERLECVERAWEEEYFALWGPRGLREAGDGGGTAAASAGAARPAAAPAAAGSDGASPS